MIETPALSRAAGLEIRIASEGDADSLSRIYAPFVSETAVSFECVPPNETEFKDRICLTLSSYPYLVALEDGHIAGYAYASRFAVREAYRYSAEVSIYLDPAFHGKGIGRKLYSVLESILKQQGIHTLYACIAVPDGPDDHLSDNSRKFHEKMGYSTVARYHHCGYKFEHWYSVIWMEKTIIETEGPPSAFIPFPLLPDEAVRSALCSY